jgi:hypothetical protein
MMQDTTGAAEARLAEVARRLDVCSEIEALIDNVRDLHPNYQLIDLA